MYEIYDLRGKFYGRIKLFVLHKLTLNITNLWEEDSWDEFTKNLLKQESLKGWWYTVWHVWKLKRVY